MAGLLTAAEVTEATGEFAQHFTTFSRNIVINKEPKKTIVANPNPNYHPGYGDGSISKYVVTDIQEYQALQPDSPRSDFRDLGTDKVISASELFKRMYMESEQVTFQTCIWKGDEDSWGRLFVIADPI